MTVINELSVSSLLWSVRWFICAIFENFRVSPTLDRLSEKIRNDCWMKWNLTVVRWFLRGHLLLQVTHFGWWVIRSGKHFCALLHWLQTRASENERMRIFKDIKRLPTPNSPELIINFCVDFCVFLQFHDKKKDSNRSSLVELMSSINFIREFQNFWVRQEKMPKTSSKHQKSEFWHFKVSGNCLECFEVVETVSPSFVSFHSSFSHTFHFYMPLKKWEILENLVESTRDMSWEGSEAHEIILWVAKLFTIAEVKSQTFL